ncbi:hypothetical protein AOLI_G00050240 [Acnodon oligacanthus]
MTEDDLDIAVVGIGCNFPGGEGLDNFWKVLLEGKNCAVEIPGERFDCAEWYDQDDSKPGKSRTQKATLADGFNEFDHKFFGISEAEVEQMDPQHKVLLQCTYRALEDAGIPMEKASGSRTGVFLGLMNRDYELTMANVNPVIINHCTGTGIAMSIAANRVSYTFNFTGPSLSIDCACSSSLVALHLACQAMREGDCEMAVCGGVSCIFQPRVFVALSKAKMISPGGTSKPFSNKADGYGRGEGCGVILLKPLKKALEDHDNIWGIICKTAVNQDGHTVTPMTKPSMVQQEKLLSRIYSAETYLSDVQYVEAHGTGTPVGDPIEAGSISKVIAKARPAGLGPLYIGSVKSNIGHTESAAGVAGLIKVLLMMKHETIVPSVFYSEKSSSIDAQALNLKIPTKAEKWVTRVGSVRVAGINNFGFGGTNAHAVVAIANLLMQWGIRPDAVLGHSVGEVAAAHCSGLLSLEDAVKVIYYRSTLQSRVTGGKMLVVSNMSVQNMLKILPSYSGRLCLAAQNSPQSCTISGEADAIDSLHKSLYNSGDGKNLFLRVLDVPAAYHSHMMDSIVADVEKSIGSLQAQNMVTELFSSVSGEKACPTDFVNGKYWARNVREPVAFEQAIKSAKQTKNAIFVEIGPRRALQRNIMETLGNDTVVLSSVQPDKDLETMLTVVSKLFEMGVNVDWDHFYKGCEMEPIPFPRYQFDNVRRDILIEATFSDTNSGHPVITQKSKDGSVFSCDLSSGSLSYLHDHKHQALVEEGLKKANMIDSGLEQASTVSSPKEYIKSVISETIGVEQDELTDDTPLSALGLDSMLAMTLQNLIFQEKGVNIPLVTLLNPESTLSDIVKMLGGDENEGNDQDEKKLLPHITAEITRF